MSAAGERAIGSRRALAISVKTRPIAGVRRARYWPSARSPARSYPARAAFVTCRRSRRNWQTRWIQVSVAPSQNTQNAAKQGCSKSASDETLPPKSSGATSGPLAPNPRAGALADLQRRQQEAIEAGDLDLARALHGMIGTLLVGPTPTGGAVVDIATRQRGR